MCVYMARDSIVYLLNVYVLNLCYAIENRDNYADYLVVQQIAQTQRDTVALVEVFNDNR